MKQRNGNIFHLHQGSNGGLTLPQQRPTSHPRSSVLFLAIGAVCLGVLLGLILLNRSIRLRSKSIRPPAVPVSNPFTHAEENQVTAPGEPGEALLGAIQLGNETSLTPVNEVSLSTRQFSGARMTPLETTTELLGTIVFGKESLIDADAAFNLNQIEGYVVGEKMVWLITNGGLRVLDKVTNRWAYSPALTPEIVRPKNAIADPENGNVWFYGEGLFRHNARSGSVERFALKGKPLPAVRKAVPTTEGLWLATDGGVFLFDTSLLAFQRLEAVNEIFDDSFTDMAVRGEDLWALRKNRELLHGKYNAGEIVSLVATGPLPVESVASLVAIQGDLWLTALKENHDTYILSSVKGGSYAMTDLLGSVVHLKPWEGGLLFSASDNIGFVDTARGVYRTATLHVTNANAYGDQPFNVQILSVGKGLVALGMSYEFKAATGYSMASIAYVLDPSKGWKDIATESYFLENKKVSNIQNSGNDFWVAFATKLVRFIPREYKTATYMVAESGETEGQTSFPFKVIESLSDWTPRSPRTAVDQ